MPRGRRAEEHRGRWRPLPRAALGFHHDPLGNSYGSNEGVPEIGAHVVIGVGRPYSATSRSAPARWQPERPQAPGPAHLERMFQLTPTEVWSPERGRAREGST
jgi:hypothetical protein